MRVGLRLSVTLRTRNRGSATSVDERTPRVAVSLGSGTGLSRRRSKFSVSVGSRFLRMTVGSHKSVSVPIGRFRVRWELRRSACRVTRRGVRSLNRAVLAPGCRLASRGESVGLKRVTSGSVFVMRWRISIGVSVSGRLSPCDLIPGKDEQIMSGRGRARTALRVGR